MLAPRMTGTQAKVDDETSPYCKSEVRVALRLAGLALAVVVMGLSYTAFLAYQIKPEEDQEIATVLVSMG